MPGMDPITGRWTYGVAAISAAIDKAFTTPRATRVMRRWLGVTPGALLDRPIEPGMVGPVAVAIGDSLRAEPRVRLNRIGLVSGSQDGHAELVADLTILSTGDGLRRSV